MSNALTLRKLCFTGPHREPACLEFRSGLNIIYGASDTGKSFIVEAIDFMLGSSSALRDIPERVGYDGIWLEIETPDNTHITLMRSVDGGDFNLYEGSHQSAPIGIEPIVLKAKHSATKGENVSSYLLRLINLTNKKIKNNAEGHTASFSLPYLRHLCIISETDIQKSSSPLYSGQAIARTAEMSAFKLLLTGVDDSALVKSATRAIIASKEAKLEVVEELIASYEARYQRLSENRSDGDELASQLERIEAALTLDQAELGFTEETYKNLASHRGSLRLAVERSKERKAEVNDMLQRFTLLNEHYSSDIARLEGVREAGSLVALLTPGPCPLCGSETSAPHANKLCDANLDTLITATSVEKEKIDRLQKELLATMGKLNSERASFDTLIPKVQRELSDVESEISKLTPSLTEQRSSYQSLVEKRAAVRALSDLWEEIEGLKERKTALEVATNRGSDTSVASDLSTSVVDSFSQLLEATLKSWKFPNAVRVYFDQKSKDFVISGKPRGSRGKGMRAITHAAFTTTLLEFCKRENLPHLGFVVMDSPLLAYREPDIADDGISSSFLNAEFFSYLSKWTDRQAIIVENVDPPEQFTSKSFSTHFTGNPGIYRTGFFPPNTLPG